MNINIYHNTFINWISSHDSGSVGELAREPCFCRDRVCIIMLKALSTDRFGPSCRGNHSSVITRILMYDRRILTLNLAPCFESKWSSQGKIYWWLVKYMFSFLIQRSAIPPAVALPHSINHPTHYLTVLWGFFLYVVLMACIIAQILFSEVFTCVNIFALFIFNIVYRILHSGHIQQ